MSSPVSIRRAFPLSFACMAMLAGALSACSAVGTVEGGGQGAAAGNGTGTTGAGSASGGGAGAGGIAPIMSGTSNSLSWYDSLQAANCSAAPTALPSSRIWRLSTTQWQNTVGAALGLTAPNVSSFPEDQLNATTGYSDDSTGDKITFPLASAYFSTSDTVATQAATAAVTSMSCLGTAPIAMTCAQTFASTYGQKLFRRALTSAEAGQYATYLVSESELDPAATAVASMLKAMLMSPNFLYRTEIGNSKPGVIDMTPDEVASLLSYSIADIPPDAQLVAAQGQLTDPATRTAQAERLAALPSAQTKLQNFWREYLALGDQPTMPGAELSAFNEGVLFIKNVVLANNGTLKDLLTAPYTYVTPTDTMYAKTYGTNLPDPTTGKLMLDPTQRSGFLTSVAMLTQTSAPSQAATVIHRGLLVRERVLCQIPPPPPATVVPDPAQIQQAGANATAKQNYALFTTTHASCNACHSFFQPLGLAFEAYDANGFFRTQYPAPISQPIDTTGMLTSAGDAMGSYQDVVGMASMLGNSQMAGYCMAQQFGEYALGRSIEIDQESCMVKSMGDYVTGKGGQLRTLLASFAGTSTLTRRVHQ